MTAPVDVADSAELGNFVRNLRRHIRRSVA